MFLLDDFAFSLDANRFCYKINQECLNVWPQGNIYVCRSRTSLLGFCWFYLICQSWFIRVVRTFVLSVPYKPMCEYVVRVLFHLTFKPDSSFHDFSFHHGFIFHFHKKKKKKILAFQFEDSPDKAKNVTVHSTLILGIQKSRADIEISILVGMILQKRDCSRIYW